MQFTRPELIKSFANINTKCKQQCPYNNVCERGDFCVFKQAALIMRADDTRVQLADRRAEAAIAEARLQAEVAKQYEDVCFQYYDMIHDYNGGVVKKLYIPPARKMATKRLRRTLKARRLVDRDGKPEYAPKSERHVDYDLRNMEII